MKKKTRTKNNSDLEPTELASMIERLDKIKDSLQGLNAETHQEENH